MSAGEAGAARCSEETTVGVATALVVRRGVRVPRGDAAAAVPLAVAVRRFAATMSAECFALHALSTSTTMSIFFSAKPDGVSSCCTVSAGL